ncbi:MAG: HEPN domain-containing protein [Bacteroidales bacterium]|jgi:HEPN domain-containing protein|nr:HEPN domain-containing protein [Bacteroidales bacterium]
MTNEERIQHWIDLSKEDLRTGKTLLRGRHYLYVGFMCHQTIEKIFKAYYAKQKEDTPPYTHKLIFLAHKSELYDLLSEEQKDLINVLDPLNIEARYPEYKSAIAKTLNHAKCVELLEQTKILWQWTVEAILSTK